MWCGKPTGSKLSIGAMAWRPALRAEAKSSAPIPTLDSGPTPVTTTRTMSVRPADADLDRLVDGHRVVDERLAVQEGVVADDLVDVCDVPQGVAREGLAVEGDVAGRGEDEAALQLQAVAPDALQPQDGAALAEGLDHQGTWIG